MKRGKAARQVGKMTEKIVIAFVFICIILGIVGFFGGAAGLDNEYATRNAEVFIRNLDLEVKSFQCNGIDSDGDGYVSCTFSMKNGSTRQFECAGWSFFNDGCREPKMKIHSTSND